MFLILKGKTGAEITIDSTKIDVYEPEGDGCILQMQYGAVHVTDSYAELNRVLCARRPFDFAKPLTGITAVGNIALRSLATQLDADSIKPMIQVNARYADDPDDMYRPRSFDPLRIAMLCDATIDNTFAMSAFIYNSRNMFSTETKVEIQAKIDKVTK